jgi:hypothetical protein
MKERLLRWLNVEPVWWHFWNPKTGPAGGMVCGIVLVIVFLIVRAIAK